MEPKLIDIADWTLAGEGDNGQSFYHKSDDSLILKLNRGDMPRERAEKEFTLSKAVYDSGIPCPQVFEFVTDGTRLGVVGQRIKDKKSFVRMIADDKSLLEPLAKEFAARSRAFHSVQCDTAVIQSFKEKARSLYGSAAGLTAEAKEMLFSYLDDMNDATTAVHGDFQPGNIIRSEGRDYWIDLGDFTYGDPDIDMASLLLLSEYTPAGVVKFLFHISKKEVKRFVEIYGAEYYGSRWHSKELDEKLDKALCLRMGISVSNRPRSSFMFTPFILGRKFRARFIAGLCDLILSEKVYNSISKRAAKR